MENTRRCRTCGETLKRGYYHKHADAWRYHRCADGEVYYMTLDKDAGVTVLVPLREAQLCRF